MLYTAKQQLYCTGIHPANESDADFGEEINNVIGTSSVIYKKKEMVDSCCLICLSTMCISSHWIDCEILNTNCQSLQSVDLWQMGEQYPLSICVRLRASISSSLSQWCASTLESEEYSSSPKTSWWRQLQSYAKNAQRRQHVEICPQKRLVHGNTR